MSAALHDLSAASDDAIRAAVVRGEYERAATFVVARAHGGSPVPGRIAADVYPGVDHYGTAVAVIAASGSGRAPAFLEMVERSRLFSGPNRGVQGAVALFWTWKLDEPEALRGRFVTQARLLLQQHLTADGGVMLARLARLLGDEHLDAQTEVFTKALSILEATGRAPADVLPTPLEILDRYPAPAPVVHGHGFTLRAPARAGRNELCPCGSGKKYKRCHEGDPSQMLSASPISGLSWDEWLRTSAATMTCDDVRKLALRDLLLLDLTQLERRARIDTLRAFLRYRRWDAASRAVDAMATAGAPPEEVDEWREELLFELREAGEHALIEQHVARLHRPEDLSLADRVPLLVRRAAPDVLAQLEELAKEAVCENEPGTAIELAYGLLDSSPALGILLARGCLSEERALDAETLLIRIEEARAALGASPVDPAWDTWWAVEDAAEEEQQQSELESLVSEKAKRDIAELARLRRTMRANDARLAELEKLVEAQQARLAESSERSALATLAATPVAPGAHDREGAAAAAATSEAAARHAATRAKLAEYKALINEGNEERRRLRQELARISQEHARQARDRDEAPPVTIAIADTDETGEAIEPTSVPRTVLVPRFGRHAEDAVREVPAQVAGDAVRLVGELAAGDKAAWRGVKQAKDMPRPTLMARIGIHHRLIFRCADGVLEAIELVTRENLDVTLKRLRGR